MFAASVLTAFTLVLLAGPAHAQRDGRDLQVHVPVVFLSAGLGANFLTEEGIDFDDFNQFIELEPGAFVSLGGGVILPGFFGDHDVKVGVDVNHRVLGVDAFGNIGGPANQPLTGDLESTDVVLRLDLEWNIDDGYGRTILRPNVGVSVGGSYQNLETFQAGVPAFRGDGFAPTANVHAGFRVPVTDRVAVGLEGNVSWTRGIDVSAGANTSSMDDRIEGGIMLRADVLMWPTAQPSEPAIFTDGFESGNISVWSTGPR